MVSATEALVAGMATEAANTVWEEFLCGVRKDGNHGLQVTGRKHLKTIMREIEGRCAVAVNELDGFVAKLEPKEAAAAGRVVWDRNYHNFVVDVRSAYDVKCAELAKYSVWYFCWLI